MTAELPLPDVEHVERIACLMLNGIGDTLCVTPAFASLREHYPHAEITALVRPNIHDLVAGNPAIDRVIHYDTDHGLARRLDFFRQIRRHRFDLWVDLHVPTFNTLSSNGKDFLRNAILMRIAAPRYRVGYAVRQLAKRLSHPLPLPTEHQLRTLNIADLTLALTRPASGKVYRKHLPVSDADRQWAEQALPDTRGLRIALFFGSRQAADLWPDEHIFAFLDTLSRWHANLELVMIGGAEERVLSDKIDAFFAGRGAVRISNFIERCTLNRSGALLQRCDAFVCTDSGPMHMADALEVPTVALISSKNHVDIWRPQTRNSLVLNHAVPCGPCFNATCHNDSHCMKLITPAEAFHALETLLARIGRHAPGSAALRTEDSAASAQRLAVKSPSGNPVSG